MVGVKPSSDPIDQYLEDVNALQRLTQLDDATRFCLVCAQCRLAVEAALTRLHRQRQLSAGIPHEEVDQALRGATGLAGLVVLCFPEPGSRPQAALQERYGRDVGPLWEALRAGNHGKPDESPLTTKEVARQTRKLLRALRQPDDAA